MFVRPHLLRLRAMASLIHAAKLCPCTDQLPMICSAAVAPVQNQLLGDLLELRFYGLIGQVSVGGGFYVAEGSVAVTAEEA